MPVNPVSPSANLPESANGASRMNVSLSSNDNLSFKALLNQGMSSAQPPVSSNASNVSKPAQPAQQNNNTTQQTPVQSTPVPPVPAKNTQSKNPADKTDTASDDGKTDSKTADSTTTDPNANAQLLAMLGIGAQAQPAAGPATPAASDTAADSNTVGDVSSATKDKTTALPVATTPQDKAATAATDAASPDTVKASATEALVATPATNSKDKDLNTKDAKAKTTLPAAPSATDDENSQPLANDKKLDAPAVATDKPDNLKAVSGAAKDNETALAAKEGVSRDNFKQVLDTVKDSVSNTPQPVNHAAVIGNPVSVQQITNPAAVELNQLAPRVGTTGWDKAVGQKVVWMVGEGLQSAELTLNPPDLGPLHVVLKVTNDQASASFTAAQPEVREALESAMPRLRQMMSDAGVQLSGFSVSAQTSGQQQSSGQSFSSGRNTGHNSVADNGPVSVTTTPVTIRTSTKAGEVDTFA